jgi:hypothetical protein
MVFTLDSILALAPNLYFCNLPSLLNQEFDVND